MRCSRRWKTRAQQQGGLKVAEAAFGFQEGFIAQGGVFGADVWVGGGDEVLAVEAGLGFDFRGVDFEASVGLLGQPAAEGGVVAQGALGADVGGLVAGAGLVSAGTLRVAGGLLADAGQLRVDASDRVVALLLVALFLFGVVADDEPGVAAVDVDFFDPQVVLAVLVAALAGQDLLDEGLPSRMRIPAM